MSDTAEESTGAASPLERLLAIQEEDTAVDQLEHRRAHLPERDTVDQHAAVVAGIQAEQARRTARQGELTTGLERLQAEVASLEARIAEVHRTLHSGAVTVPRELQALQHEEESLKRRQDHLETEELELMEQLDPLNEELQAAEQQLGELAADGERLDEALLAAEARIEEELTQVTARRRAAAAEVDAELLDTYEDLRARLGGVAVARLVGSVCGGCHLSLPAAEVDRIKKQAPDALVRCDECGRLLVR